jgi:phospholipase C
MIESVFGLNSLTARDANAENLGMVLGNHPRRPVPKGVIPTSSQVMGPVSDAAAICSADSVQSVSPTPVKHGPHPHVEVPVLPQSGWPTGSGMVGFGKEHRKNQRS